MLSDGYIMVLNYYHIYELWYFTSKNTMVNCQKLHDNTMAVIVSMIRSEKHTSNTSWSTLNRLMAKHMNPAVRHLPAGSRFTEALDLGGAEHETRRTRQKLTGKD